MISWFKMAYCHIYRMVEVGWSSSDWQHVGCWNRLDQKLSQEFPGALHKSSQTRYQTALGSQKWQWMVSGKVNKNETEPPSAKAKGPGTFLIFVLFHKFDRHATHDMVIWCMVIGWVGEESEGSESSRIFGWCFCSVYMERLIICGYDTSWKSWSDSLLTWAWEFCLVNCWV